MKLGVGWIVEVDIRKFFETLDHAQLREMLSRRVRDGVVLRLIDKWLQAGVLEEGVLTTPDAGTPQGGVISPLLANIYLHYVLDEWLEREVKPRLVGKAFMVRYADDFVIGFENESDAKRVYEVLPKRFAKYGLTLNEEKTRLIDFQRPTASSKKAEPGKRKQPSGKFDLLGLTHYWGKSKKGYWVVQRKTAGSRFARALKTIASWCRTHYHDKVDEQCRSLGQKLRGHFGYYGITGNAYALRRFRHEVSRVWFKWLGRRQRHGYFSWPDFNAFLQRYPLPPARVVLSLYRPAAKP